MSKGFLYSRIGYDMFQVKRALIRDDKLIEDLDGSKFELIKANEVVYRGEIKYWGKRNEQHWWTLDFSEVDTEGRYEVRFKGIEAYVPKDCTPEFEIGNNILWNKSALKVGIEQFEERQECARHKLGWKDCGAPLRETYDQAISVIELCDFWYKGHQWFEADWEERLTAQITNGLDFLQLSGALAQKLGGPKGSFVYEIPDNYRYDAAANSYFSAYAFLYAARIMRDYDLDQCDVYLQLGKEAFDLLMSPDYEPCFDGYGHYNHGVPADYVPPKDWITRDLFMLLNCAVELCKNGLTEYKEQVQLLAKRLLLRQVREDEAQDGIYGHFFAFDDRAYTEKIWAHNGQTFDLGAVYPYDVIALAEGAWFCDPQLAGEIEAAVQCFTYKYLIPVSQKTPFGIAPLGYFDGHGWLDYSGTWHGTNAAYSLMAKLAFKLAEIYEDRQIADVGYCHLQWIAGVNFGIDNTSFKGTSNWKETFDHELALPFSQIYGVGDATIRCWSDIVGSIPNGFCTNKQFRTETEICTKNDVPIYYADEDWIPHGAAWVSALAALRNYVFFYRRDIHVDFKKKL